MGNALSVVEDPVRTRWTGSLTNAQDGAWPFGRLMTNMAGPNNASAFVRNRLGKWETARTVNGDLIPARPAMTTLISNWPNNADGSLDLTRAPLRLLALVNRLDLSKMGNAGEVRFVFGVLDSTGNATSFTVTRFAGKGVVPANINGSSISQVRTNEIALDSPWALRQFTLGSAGRTRGKHAASGPSAADVWRSRIRRFNARP